MVLRNVFCICTFFATVHGNSHALPKWESVESSTGLSFKYDPVISDEFNEWALDTKKWSASGLTNGNTGCPKWNGPIYWKDLKYSTYFQTNTKKESPNHRVRWGVLRLRVTKQRLSYFTSREYYCNPRTFKCNWDSSRDCFGTNYWGDPVLKNKDNPKSYKLADHDKCKMEPFCIPSPKYVTKSKRIYRKYLGVNIVGKKLFKYGFIEARVKLAKSSAVTAVWMHDDNYHPGFSRWTDDPHGYPYRETPSYIRSRRWQEIDILEAMNSEVQSMNKKYIPNIHVFAGYKGEFTASHKNDRELGPIVLDKEVIRQKNPRFSDPATKHNEFHLNPESIAELDREWGAGWRTVGLYWSESEIRFILDGVEKLRLKNYLVHQPMFMSIAVGLNRGWAGRAPYWGEMGKWSEIDYIRRWEVSTGIEEPHSSLPVEDTMEKKFRFIGNSFLSVEGKFPVQDDGLSLPEVTNNPYSWLENGPTKQFWSVVNGNKNIVFHMQNSTKSFQVEHQHSGYKPNISDEEIKLLHSLNMHAHETTGSPDCGESTRTIFEDTNPQTNLGGWATEDGEGQDAGIVPEYYCTK